MANNRREFLKIAGACVVGVGATAPVLVSAVARASKSAPAPGKRSITWAMIVDTNKCLAKDGCTACSDACHYEHNVPKIPEKEHEIKWIWKERYEHTFPEQVHQWTEDSLKHQPIPLLCNHCENPPCVRVCPTQATFKRVDIDGIVTMDMHRCIGCRYCISACPYGARSFNFRDPRPFIAHAHDRFPSRMKGVVEKCNFCAERLNKQLASNQEPEPYCVQACKERGNGALVFGNIQDPNSRIVKDYLRKEHTIRRKPMLGTEPHVFYTVGTVGGRDA